MKPATFIRKSFAVLGMLLTIVTVLFAVYHRVHWSVGDAFVFTGMMACVIYLLIYVFNMEEPVEEHLLILSPEQQRDAEQEFDELEAYERLTA